MGESLNTTSTNTSSVRSPVNVIVNHPTKLKYEKGNYELAQQDRAYEDKNLCMAKGDLGFLDAGKSVAE